MAAPAPVAPIPIDDAKNALKEALDLFSKPENVQRLNEAKAAAGGDIMKILATVTPIALGLAGEIINKYGYQATQQGVMQFFTAVQQHATDAEVAQLVAQLRGMIMPTSFAAPQ